MRALVVSPLVLAACLSKPDRPAGFDASPDARPDAAVPTFTVRRDIEVGDINGDGHDDLLRWGNVVEGEQPRVWVYYGSATGLSPDPNLTIDPTFDGTAAWFEVLDVSVDEVDPGIPNPEVMVLVAEDDSVPNGNNPVDRALHVDVWSPFTSGTTDPLGRSGVVRYDSLGGLARASTPAFVLRRHKSDGLPEIVFGGLGVTWELPDLSTASFGIPEVVRMVDGGGTMLPNIQDAFVSPGAPDDNLLAVDQGVAWLSDGDSAGAPPPAFSGISVGIAEGNRRRAARRAYGVAPAIAVAGGEGSPFVQIVQDEAGVPAVYALPVNPEEPVDQAIGNVGGTGQIDVVTLDDNQLVVYRDVNLEPGGTANASMILPGPADLVGYNVLAIGNFSDLGSGNEIYVLGNSVVPRCFVVSGNNFDPC